VWDHRERTREKASFPSCHQFHHSPPGSLFYGQ
jgi:hypothetical protein